MTDKRPLRILFVEDLPSDAILAEREIRKSGIKFTSQRVDTKDAFLKALDEFRPDVIVSDYSMPEFDGMQALQLSLEHDWRIPFVLLTGSLNEETAVTCMKAGAWDYVLKERIARLPFAVKDALERKKMLAAKDAAEQALRESEHRNRTFLDSTSDMAFLKDDKFRHILANRALCKFYGKTEDEIKRKEDFDLMSEEFALRCRATDEQTLRSNALTVNEEFVRDRCFESVKFPVAIAEGKVGVGGYIRDITERKRAEDALVTSEARLSSAVTMAHLGHWEYDVASDLFTFNDHFYAMLRTTARQVGGYTMSSSQYAQRFVHPDDMPLVGIETRKALETNDPLYTVQLEHRIIYADGQAGYITVRIFIVKDDQGRTIKTYGVNQDISERKRVEQALADSERKFKWLFDYAPVAYHVLTPEGIISDVNVRWCETLGYSRDEVLGRTIFDFILPGELSAAKLAFETKKKHISSIRARNERTYVAKNGTPKTFLVGDFVTTDAQGNTTSIQTTLEDITERKQSERKLRLSEERFRSVWDNSADGMRLTDREGRIIDVNGAFCMLMRKSREELVGKVLSVAYQSQGPDDDLSLYHKRFDTGETISNLFGSTVLWNGETIDLHISSSFIESAGQERLLLSLFRDVSEQKKAETRLEEERKLLRTIIDAIPDEITVKDVERRFVLVNPETVRALGKTSSKEIIGKRDEDLIPERFALEAKKEEEMVLATGRSSINRQGKSRINAATGEIERSILISKIALKDQSGDVTGLVAINRDITEVQRASAALEKERTLLRTLIESIPDEICLKDPSHRFVVANSAVARAMGVPSVEDLLGKTDLDFASPELARIHFDEEDAILASGHPIINLERTRRSPLTGEIEKCLLTTKVPVKDNTGQKIGILVINRYITERKKAEEALRASEEKFRSLFEESKDVVYISTADGRLQDINAAGVQLFGYDSKADLLRIDLGRDSYTDLALRGRFRSEIARAGFVKDFELTLKTRTGELLTVLETATAVRDKKGNVVMHRGIIRDVTRQRLLERQFLQAQKMESIGTLAGGIAHDFNNILGIILGHLALLERTRDNDVQFEESIFSISKAVDRGASLVRQILTFARKTDTQLEPVNINAMIKELAKMLDETFPKTMPVTLHLDKIIPAILMDPAQLHQALLNLCVNARDAMSGQGTLVLATNLVTGQDVIQQFPEAGASHYLRVSVTDTGVGMDDETKQRIFEPFFTTKEKGKGTGLGLAVVYGVLQAHHGFIDVVSAKGSGTTFHLFFPVPEGILAPAMERVELEPDLPRGTETILVVEDEDILRDLLVKLLEMQGYHVIQASDGDEAVRRFKEHAGEIDLVLSDMGLPKRNGWDAVNAMRSTRSKVRALLASGYLDPGQKSEVLKSGIKGFIQKPYKMEEVLKAVRDTLDAKDSLSPIV